MRRHSVLAGCFATQLVLGCGSTNHPSEQTAAPEASAPAADASEADASEAPTEAPAAAAPVAAAAGQITCALSCSGVEKTAQGSTEEEARAAATALVESTCDLDDGQYFITCLPAVPE